MKTWLKETSSLPLHWKIFNNFFRLNIKYFPQITTVCRRMIEAANMLGMKIIATEQYPQGNFFYFSFVV